MRFISIASVALTAVSFFSCKPKDTDTEVLSSATGQAPKHLLAPRNGYFHKGRCVINIPAGSVSASKSLFNVPKGPKEVDGVLNRLLDAGKVSLCIDMYVEKKDTTLKLEDTCSVNECSPPVTGIQQLSGVQNAEIFGGNFVARTSVEFKNLSTSEKSQLADLMKQQKVTLLKGQATPDLQQR